MSNVERNWMSDDTYVERRRRGAAPVAQCSRVRRLEWVGREVEKVVGVVEYVGVWLRRH